MSHIEKYFMQYSDRLRSDFSRIRSTHKDSDVKGGANEEILRQFIEAHFNSNFVATNCDVIDSHGKMSSEMDICVCNHWQPFGPEPGQMLLAEGVDFIVQVKAKLSTSEIVRLCKNASSAKSLLRRPMSGATAYGDGERQEFFLKRIPYVAFAYTSEVTLQKVYEEVTVASKASQIWEQPDAIFILDRGFLLNFHEGKGNVWNAGGAKMKGWMIGETDSEVLLNFVQYLYTIVPRISYPSHPITQYVPKKVAFPIKGITTVSEPKNS